MPLLLLCCRLLLLRHNTLLQCEQTQTPYRPPSITVLLQACHDDFQRVANIPKAELPQCPVAPKALAMEQEECPLHLKHPATGTPPLK